MQTVLCQKSMMTQLNICKVAGYRRKLQFANDIMSKQEPKIDQLETQLPNGIPGTNFEIFGIVLQKIISDLVKVLKIHMSDTNNDVANIITLS